jgi:crotonobetainyl-CoA:carnitine CoA-transferase CaiB-like acyl-CoA transferase
MTKILSDIRVLDLSHVWFGPFCTMMLADMGAEVIRVEPPWGAIDRIARGALFGGASYSFHHLNLNKKGITLNLKTEEGLSIFKNLVKQSDVVVQNFRAGVMERLGIGYEVLKSLKPDIIYAALSGFGQYGPYSTRGSYNTIVESMSGHMRLTGDIIDPEGPPIEIAGAYGDFGPALFAAMSIIAAIRHRDLTGTGQMIDVAQYDCMVAVNPALTCYNLANMKPYELKKKYPLSWGHGGLLRTKKGGWVRLAVNTPKAIESLRGKWSTDEVDQDLIKAKVGEMERDEAVEFFSAIGVPVGPVYHVDETVEDTHLAAREMFVEVEHQKAGRIKVLNFPVKFSETPGEVRTAAPLIGQHNREVLKNLLGYSDDKIKTLEKMGVISLPQ